MADKKKAELAKKMLAEAAENPINENVIKRIAELIHTQKKDEKDFMGAAETIAERMMHNDYMTRMHESNKIRFDGIVGSDGRITIPQATLLLHQIEKGTIITVEVVNVHRPPEKKPKAV
jgi:hypothetical protein